MSARILIAGVGNIFLGDDAFGVEVALALCRRVLPDGVTVKDFGIRGLDLAYALLDPWDAVIIVDALQRGEAPGTLYVLEPDREAAAMDLNPHGMDPVRVLSLAASMGSVPGDVLVLGCEPQTFGDVLEGRMGLSSPVQAAVDEAATMALQLAARIAKTKAEVRLQPVER